MMSTSDELHIDSIDVLSAALTPSGAVPIFTCSSSSCEGSGSLTITTDAVYLGEDDGVLRVATSDIRNWYTESRGSLFALTVVSDRDHVTTLFSQLHAAVHGVLTRTIGPEHRSESTV